MEEVQKKGKFIVIEGLDGSGSTTQAVLLAKYLFEKDKCHVPVLTREPTSLTSYGKEIRRRLKNELLPNEEVIDDFGYWADLFVKDREWHLKNIVEHNTKMSLSVISDRHMLSTLAYQSSQGGDIKKLVEMHNGFVRPDMTIFLRISVETALQRQGKRGDSTEYFEKEHVLKKVAENYEKAISLIGEEQNVVIVDGSLTVEEVFNLIRNEVDKLYDY